KHTWIGLLSTPTVDWVRDGSPWHCTGVIQDPSVGKHLVAWDCEPRPGVSDNGRISNLLDGQRAFWRFLRQRHRATSWCYRGQAHSGQDLCLAYSLQTIRRRVDMGDMPFQDNGDPRIRDCVRMTRV
ncbi:hypothetical protein QBC37DRAFT_460283, partial [Rhypophila decipiens]